MALSAHRHTARRQRAEETRRTGEASGQHVRAQPLITLEKFILTSRPTRACLIYIAITSHQSSTIVTRRNIRRARRERK